MFSPSSKNRDGKDKPKEKTNKTKKRNGRSINFSGLRMATKLVTLGTSGKHKDDKRQLALMLERNMLESNMLPKLMHGGTTTPGSNTTFTTNNNNNNNNHDNSNHQQKQIHSSFAATIDSQRGNQNVVVTKTNNTLSNKPKEDPFEHCSKVSLVTSKKEHDYHQQEAPLHVAQHTTTSPRHITPEKTTEHHHHRSSIIAPTVSEDPEVDIGYCIIGDSDPLEVVAKSTQNTFTGQLPQSITKPSYSWLLERGVDRSQFHRAFQHRRMSETLADFVLKVVVIGPINTGKTSFCTRYCKHAFGVDMTEIRPTIVFDMHQAHVKYKGTEFNLVIYDMAGDIHDKDFSGCATNFVNQADCLVLAYDTSSSNRGLAVDHFYSLSNIKKLLDTAQSHNIPIVLVGMKFDLIADSPEEIKDNTNAIRKFVKHCPLQAAMVTSAKLNNNVMGSFTKIIQLAICHQALYKTCLCQDCIFVYDDARNEDYSSFILQKNKARKCLDDHKVHKDTKLKKREERKKKMNKNQKKCHITSPILGDEFNKERSLLPYTSSSSSSSTSLSRDGIVDDCEESSTEIMDFCDLYNYFVMWACG